MSLLFLKIIRTLLARIAGLLSRKVLKVNMINGLILGKFMPLHLGHEFLIEEGLKKCDILHVVVCSLSSEPIDGKIRYKWMKNRFSNEITNGKMKVYHLEEDWIPQEPNECNSRPAFFGCWAGVMKSICNHVNFNYMFASESYVFDVSNAIGCTPILVDIGREMYPISGTMCRNNPYKYWNYMNKEVRSYFTKKILVIGGESTGKSTLTKVLEDYCKSLKYNTIGIQEFAREWIDSALNGNMDKLEFEYITMFGRVQMELVNRYLGEKQIIISDTDAVVSEVFQYIYYGKVSNELENIAENEKWDLVLFCHPDIPWVDDGQRNLGSKKDREKFANTLIKRMKTLKFDNIVSVYGDFEKREKIAKNAVDNLLQQV